MTGIDIQETVDSLAARLHRSVVINDPEIRMQFASRHFDDEDEVRVRAILQRDAGASAIGHILAQGVSTWTTAGIIPANDELGMKARVCVPIRWHGHLLGQLIVMDGEGTLTTSELALINEAARDVAAAMAVREREGAKGQLHEQMIVDLIGSEPTLRRRALSELAAVSDTERFAHITAAEVGVSSRVDAKAESHAESALRSVMRMDFRFGDVSTASAVTSTRGTLLLGSAVPMDERIVEKHVRTMLDQLEDMASGRFACTAGISSAALGPEEAHHLAKQAHLACRAAAIVFGKPIVRWRDLGPYSLLLRIPAEELNRGSLPDEVQRLLAVDSGSDLVSTLRVYLDCACNGPAASEALHIHRTTLYYRLNRISELTGLDLSDGVTRLNLHLGLTMLDLLDA